MTSPFLAWAGGKAGTLPDLKASLPDGFDPATWLYIEPFLGGGALFLDLMPKTAIVGDLNYYLFDLWRALRDFPEEVITKLTELKNKMEGMEGKERENFYYEQREKFNYAEDGRFNDRAARFIYLNKTNFNALWRVNSSGKYNVPYGKKKNPSIFDPTHLREVASYLNNNNVEIRWEPAVDSLSRWRGLSYPFSFETKMASWIDSAPGIFAYLDPPYDTDSGQHTSYTAEGFNRKDQEALAVAANSASERGWKIMMSNADTDFIWNLYSGWNIKQRFSPRSIAADPNERREVIELLITNYESKTEGSFD